MLRTSRKTLYTLSSLAGIAAVFALGGAFASPPNAGQKTANGKSTASAKKAAKRAAQNTKGKGTKVNKTPTQPDAKVVKSEDEWKKLLTPEQYDVLRQHGTERAFTGKFWNNHETGTYTCAACGEELFSSDTKFESGTGWPSFWSALGDKRIQLVTDNSYGMKRVEVRCARCGGHLGHLFDDGPNPTGQRYCINSVSLDFKKK